MNSETLNKREVTINEAIRHVIDPEQNSDSDSNHLVRALTRLVRGAEIAEDILVRYTILDGVEP
jgi:hypothetical protein